MSTKTNQKLMLRFIELLMKNYTKIIIYLFTWSGIQAPGMPNDSSRSEPQTSITFKDASIQKTKKLEHFESQQRSRKG